MTRERAPRYSCPSPRRIPRSCWYARSRRRPSSRFKIAEFEAYADLRPYLFEATIPSLAGRTVDGLRAILAHRLEVFGIGIQVENLIVDEALAALASLYGKRDGSIRHVFAALEVAAAAAIDSDANRLQAGHVRLGIEDWGDR